MTREEAIQQLKIMRQQYSHIRRQEREWEAVDMAIEALRQEKPKGRWIEEGLMMWKCSECGLLSFSDSHFCSDCGADMRNNEEQDV